MAKPLTDKERDCILEQYVHTLELIDTEEELQNNAEANRFEADYADDEYLACQMPLAKKRRIDFLRSESLKYKN